MRRMILPMPQPRVLVIEDNREIRLSARFVLEDLVNGSEINNSLKRDNYRDDIGLTGMNRDGSGIQFH